MKYLLYYRNGFLKKFPLDKKHITIGREHDNNLIVEYDFISRQHLSIDVCDQIILIKDLNSQNGTFVKGIRIKQAEISLNQSFYLGGMEFVFKTGDLKEFKSSEELTPVFNGLLRDQEFKFKLSKTASVSNGYLEMAKNILQRGLKQTDFDTFLTELPAYFLDLDGLDNLFLIDIKEGDFSVLFSKRNDPNYSDLLRKLINLKNKLSKTSGILPDSPFRYRIIPIDISTRQIFLIQFRKKNIPVNPYAEKFLSSFCREIETVYRIIESKPKKEKKAPERQKSNITCKFIIAKNKQMKRLIEQGILVAGTNLSVLIRGESGTGKELFARLIHDHSNKSQNKFVGINCAAIPENLLESELFGYEKGAFTGAFQTQKGKFELASGGTLVLDEIGDMPMSFQAKLLRVLQENEFYKLGGIKPIKVNLRIISITNKNLKEAIKKNLFRKDLYYRLVHHEIIIPPLRERREDIPELINYFTPVFCKELNKSVNGYSVKAFETLQKYNWDGNVRQLKNEINRVVSLTPAGEMITFDILSDEIKNYDEKVSENMDTKEILTDLMIRYQWKISPAAKELGITYQGLHKKLKKFKLKKPSENE